MKIGKIELPQEKFIPAIVLAAVVIAAGGYLIFFAPLMGRITKKYMECRSLESEVVYTRNIIKKAGKISGSRTLVTENEIQQVIAEVTEHGKEKRIKFIAIIPEEIKRVGKYKILPLKMKIESTYRDIGAFLGSLDDMVKGLVILKKFDLNPDGEEKSRFVTDVLVDIYVSGK